MIIYQKKVLNKEEYLTFGITRTYTTDLAYAYQKNNKEPSLSKLRERNSMLPPLWNV